MRLVLWNARGLDGLGRHPQAALGRIARRIRPGGILIAHEGGPRAAGRLQFLELLLGHLAREGYACVLPPGSALLERAGKPPRGDPA